MPLIAFYAVSHSPLYYALDMIHVFNVVPKCRVAAAANVQQHGNGEGALMRV